MQPERYNRRLCQITTWWTLVLDAAKGPEGKGSAREELMKLYGGAVYRYLLRLVRDPSVADDLGQEFAVRFLRGDFRNVHPERGRFRNFVKSAVLNLVADHYRRRKAQPQHHALQSHEAVASAESTAEFDREFVDIWRRELLTRAWEALARQESNSDQPFHTVLRFRADHPQLKSAEMAEKLSGRLGRAVTDNWVRQILYRARNLFADLLLDDVVQSLASPSPEDLEEELIELGLLEYCRPALERRGR